MPRTHAASLTAAVGAVPPDLSALPDNFSTKVQLVSLGNEHPNAALCPAPVD